VIGAGNYASRMLIPAFAKAGATFHTLAASSGMAPVQVGRKFGFAKPAPMCPLCWQIPDATAW
jgi:predicted dehydrogenase